MNQDRWRTAFLAEIDRCSQEAGGKILQSVFFGGGTPSLMETDLVFAILEQVRTRFRMVNDPEITLEANPTSVEARRFHTFSQAGVNRVSIGVQALSDASLRQLGRMHSVREARAAIEVARDNFPRFNFDLIYARQGQGLADWKVELTEALAIGSRHMSLYQLTIEEGTVFHERNRHGLLKGLPDEDLAADMYLMTQDMCESAGLPAYEVSNHAVPGEESRHNLVYWRGGDYIGIGPGAHGRLTGADGRVMTECHRSPAGWLDAVERFGHGEMPRVLMQSEEQGSELLMMGLRLVQGVSRKKIEAALGRKLDRSRLENLQTDGLLLIDGDRLRASREGMLLLNRLLGDMLLTGR